MVLRQSFIVVCHLQFKACCIFQRKKEYAILNSRPEVVFLDIRAARKKVLVNLKSQLYIGIFSF